MKLWKLDVQAGNGVDEKTMWFAGQTEAKSYRFQNHLKGQSELMSEEVPTKKVELLAWLNARG